MTNRSFRDDVGTAGLTELDYEPGGIGEDLGGKLGVGGEVQDQTGDAGLGFPDTDLAELSVADGDGGGEPAPDLRAGIDEIEEDAVRIAEAILQENRFRGEVNGDASDRSLGPEANVGEDGGLCERRSRHQGEGEQRFGEAAVHLVRKWIRPSVSVKISIGRCSGGFGTSDWGEAVAV